MGNGSVPVAGVTPDAQEHVPDLAWRELRIAPVMTGGTSLAIWMGGATAELYRASRALREPTNNDDGLGIYRSLLQLTRTEATVDIITGTSAGGLNGVLLAAATTLDTSIERFMETRTTWQDAGDIEKLLRSRTESNPPSLLKGDDYFIDEVSKAIAGFRPNDETFPIAASPPVDLVTTLTTITPVPRTRVDSFGAPINEVNFAQQLRFTPAHLQAELFDGWAPKLATAARTSASIPGVFEPSFLPMSVDDATVSNRPNFTGHASFAGSRWAVDGGVVVNLPLTEALDRIYDRGARAETRRVVLYVSPTPPGAMTAKADKFGTVPSLKASLSTLIAGPRAEGIASDVDEIERRNELVTRQIESRAAMGLVGAAFNITPTLFATYKQRRSVASIQRMLEDALGTTADGELESTTPLLVEARMALLPVEAEDIDSPESPTFDYVARRWGWGIAPVDEAVSIALGIVSRAVRFEQDTERRNRLLTCKDKLHVVRARVAAVRALDDGYWTRRFSTEGGEDADLAVLAPLWYREWPYRDDQDLAAGVALFEEATAQRAATAATDALGDDAQPAAGASAAATDAYPGASAASGPDVDESESEQNPAPTRPEVASRTKAEKVDAARDAVFEVLRGAHFAVATLLFDAQADLTAVGRSITETASITDREAKAFASEVAGVLGDTESANGLRMRLLAVHQLQSVLLGDLVSREQRVELMQLTSDAYNGLDPDRTSAEKLAGPELARLGAFLKPSWRANDWFWGRMDAAHSLVVLLLDTERLLREGQMGALQQWVRELGAPEPVTNELQAIVANGRPGTVRETTRFLTRCVQLEIARTELACVAKSVVDTTERGGVEGDGGRFRAALHEAVGSKDAVPVPRSVSDDDVERLVKTMRIGTETLGDELGSKLFNRVATRTSSVAISALTGDNIGIPVVAKVLRPLRAPLQGVSSVMHQMTSATPLGHAIGVLLAATSGAIVAARLMGADVAPGFLVVAVVVLALLVTSALLRTRFWWLATTLAATSGVVGLTLLGGDLADVFYSESAPASVSVVPSGSSLVFDGDGVIRIEQGSGAGQRTDDVEVPAGGRVTIRNSAAELGQGPTDFRPQAWKAWGLMQWASVLNVAVLSVGLALLLRKRWKALAWWLVGAVLAFAAHWAWPSVLTGAPNGGAKGRFVAWATTLHDYGLGIVLLLITGWAIALALGVDVTLATFSRRKRAGGQDP